MTTLEPERPLDPSLEILPFDYPSWAPAENSPSRKPRRKAGVPLPAPDRGLQRIAELSDFGTVLLSATGKVEFASGQAQSLLGIDVGEPAAWQELVDRLQLEQASCAGADGLTVDLEHRLKTGVEQLRFQIHSRNDDASGGFLVIVRDRSAQRALEADLALAVQLRTLSRLYLGLAHDLRSPLNSIVLNLELLKRSICSNEAETGPEDGKRSTWIQVVQGETRRLSQALDRLLTQTVEAAGQRSLFDLNEVTRSVARLLTSQAKQQSAEVRTDLGTDTLPVFGHRDRIHCALLNVAINGLEAISSAGRLELATRRDGDTAVVTVSDDGPGIPATDTDRIFQLHFTTKESGTGIGLFVARSAVQADDGDLALVESSSKGTVFQASWPLTPELGSGALN